MSIRLHFIVTNIFLFGMFFLFVFFYRSSQTVKDLSPALVFFLFAVIFSAAGYLVRRKLLPAKCPACGGRTFAEGYGPVKYVCSACDHVEDTGWSYSRAHHHHRHKD
jgi:hypothetical protein